MQAKICRHIPIPGKKKVFVPQSSSYVINVTQRLEFSALQLEESYNITYSPEYKHIDSSSVWNQGGGLIQLSAVKSANSVKLHVIHSEQIQIKDEDLASLSKAHD